MSHKKDGNIAVIGAGLAGLAVAIRLRVKGYHVVVYERQSTYGGKLASFESDGFRFDKGPSLLTEPNLIDELFLVAGKNPRDYFHYERINDNCHYFFADGTRLHLTGNREADKKAITRFSSNTDADAFSEYLDQSVKTYDNVGGLFIDQEQPGFTTLLHPKYFLKYPTFFSAPFRKKLHEYNSASFKDKRLVQLFDRFGTYNGSDPYRMSGLFSMIPHLELVKGTYFPKKGMREIPESLYRLAIELGVSFQFEKNIEVRSSNNKYLIEQVVFDKVICAIDHLTFYKDVLNDQELFDQYKEQERSTSGLVFFLGINRKITELGLHNIFFSKNYEQEFRQITRESTLAKDPTIYIHVSSVAVNEDSPENCQNWFVMVNTPAGVVVDEAYKQHVFDLLCERIQTNFQIDLKPLILHQSHWDTRDIEKLTGSYMGALYGSSSNHLLSTFKRHSNQVKKYKNLYFCGGTVHPGGGIPLVLRSSKIVADLIK